MPSVWVIYEDYGDLEQPIAFFATEELSEQFITRDRPESRRFLRISEEQILTELPPKPVFVPSPDVDDKGIPLRPTMSLLPDLNLDLLLRHRGRSTPMPSTAKSVEFHKLRSLPEK